MKKFIDFSHCSRHRLVRDIDQFNYSDTSLLRVESSEGMIFVRGDTSSRSFLPFYYNEVSEDVEIYLKFKQITAASQAFANNGGGVVFCSDRENSGVINSVAVDFGTVAASGTDRSATWALYQYIEPASNSAQTGTITTKNINQQAHTWKHLKVKKNGGSYQVKAWWDGDAEPVYGAAITLSGPTSGYFGLNLSSRATLMQIQYAGIGISESAPMTPPANRTVAGIIYKPDNTIAAGATVRLYHAYTGALLGRVLSNDVGEYSFNLPILETELVHIVGVDVEGNEWKPPIHEAYPVL